MIARLLAAVLVLGIVQDILAADPPLAGAIVAPGLPLGRGVLPQARPRGDSFALGLAPLDADRFVRRLPPYPMPSPATIADRMTIVFFARTRPVKVDVHIGTDGKPLRTRWTEQIAKLFQGFDRDRDGYLNRYECEHLFPADGLRQMFQGNYYTRASGAPPTFEALDKDCDGRVSLAEFAGYYQEVAADLIRPRAAPASTAPDTTTAELFARLDTNKDGKLSQAELNSAERILLALDSDEDECVSLPEILANRTADVAPTPAPVPSLRPATRPAGPPPQEVVAYQGDVPATVVQQILKRYDANADGELTLAESGFDPVTFARFDSDKNNRLSATELDAWRTAPADVRVDLDLGDTTDKCRTKAATTAVGIEIRQSAPDRLVVRVGSQTLDFGCTAPPAQLRRQQLDSFLNGAFPNGTAFVEEKDLIGAQNQFLRVVFDAADFDADGRLTRTEFERYFDLQQSTAQLALALTYSVRTPNFFQMLDDNLDGKLGVRELRTAWNRLIVLEASGATAVTKGILQPSVTLRLTPAPFAFFDPTANGQPAPTANQPRGPIWFRKMDRNSDGDVSRLEFLGSQEDFAKLDLNADGLISLEEAEAYEKIARKKK